MAVRARTYTDLLTRAGALMGSNSLSSVDEDLLNSFFNSHIRTIWEKAAWPNISPYGERWTPDANGVVQFDMEEVLKTGLKAWWPCNEAAGATRANSHSALTGTKNLTDNNTVGRADGLVDYAADFTAASSMFLEISDEADLSTGDIDFSIHARVRLTTISADMVIVSKSDSATVREYELFYDTSEARFRFQVFDSGGTSVGTVDSDEAGEPLISTFYDIVCNHSKTNNCLSIKINNIKADVAATTGEPSDTAANFRVGAKYTTEQDFFNGRIQDVGFWKKDLTEGEGDRLWNQGKGNPYPFDLENWRIDRFFRIWSSDPTTSSYATPLNFVQVPEGALILSSVPKTVYVQYRLRVPSYTGADWASGTTYTVGNQAYLTTNGRFYIATAVTHSNETPPDTAFWRELEIPHNFFEYAARMTFADLLVSEAEESRAVMHQRQARGLMMDAFEAMPPVTPFTLENTLTEQPRR